MLATQHADERTTERSEADRTELAKMVMNLFAHWNLSTKDQLALLGLASSNRAALTNYRNGKPLANTRDLLDRVGILLGIHKSLRLLIPHNRDLAYAWMTQPNRAFEGKTPTEVIKEYSFAGLYMVRAYLDKARGQ